MLVLQHALQQVVQQRDITPGISVTQIIRASLIERLLGLHGSIPAVHPLVRALHRCLLHVLGRRPPWQPPSSSWLSAPRLRMPTCTGTDAPVPLRWVPWCDGYLTTLMAMRLIYIYLWRSDTGIGFQ